MGIGPVSAQPATITPIGLPSRSIGTPSMPPPASGVGKRVVVVGIGKRILHPHDRLGEYRSPDTCEALGRIGYAFFSISTAFEAYRSLETKCSNSPSNRNTFANRLPQRVTAFFAIASNTGCTSVGELLMTLQDVGGRRLVLSASCVSLNSRTFSIAITAWSTNDLASAISLSSNGPALSRASTSTPMHSSLRKSGSMSDEVTPVRAWMSFSCGGRSIAFQSGMCSIDFDTITRDGKFAAGSTGATRSPRSIGRPPGVA